LGIAPSHAFAKGDDYYSVTGSRKRPWGVWQLRSDSHIKSRDIADHVFLILEQLECRQELINQFIESEEYYVDIRIWCESHAMTIGYTIASTAVTRLAVLCNEFIFSFIGGGYSKVSGPDSPENNGS
jgi:hypothetical protein